MRPALIAAVSIAATGIAARRVQATPTQDLDEARTHFKAKDCSKAMPLLSLLVYPVPKLALTENLVETYAMLGACDVETGHREEAKTEFEHLLQLQPDKALDDMFFSASAIRVFDETKADIDARNKRDAELHRLDEERKKFEAYKASQHFYEQHSFGVNFVPFGAGQIQGHRRAKALFFAVTEGTTAITSAVIFGYLSTKYGLVSNNIPRADAPGVRELQQIELVTGFAAIAFYLLGVGDAIYYYQPRVQIEGDDSLLPPGVVDPTKPSKPRKTSLRDRLHLGPVVTPSGVGLGLSLENY